MFNCMEEIRGDSYTSKKPMWNLTGSKLSALIRTEQDSICERKKHGETKKRKKDKKKKKWSPKSS